MKIAIIGGGASGMVTAYLLDKKGHHVTVFEKQPILGGHIRTLNKNVKPNHSDCDRLLEGGVLEFPVKFYHFLELMKELEVELEPVQIGSALFLKDGRHFLSALMIEKNFTGIQRVIEYLRRNIFYACSSGLQRKMRSTQIEDLYNQPISQYLKGECVQNWWLKLLTMYNYSIPFALIDNFPTELAIPVLQDYLFVDWVRIKGGVYSYIEKILQRFKGEILLNVEIEKIFRQADSVKITLSNGVTHLFDKVVFATPPDQVMKLLSDPTNEEIKRFSAWQENYAKTVMHTDTLMYSKHGFKQSSEFDFFETDKGWGYNAYLNQLCGISSSLQYSLAFNLNDLIAKDKILHIQEHHTPLYTVESFRYRKEVIVTNGENNTYHAGAYLGDGLHEGAITSAIRVAQLID
ncbi:MAG: FAD-dependent oxidoreductase [Cyanomargarita calcarea GSE-NOS-MK-12-04C]|jgi:predicted NAD/FAD-binding protein|uniref:FAD-dependent oxidoreductase n=1 Tax=Cyanomargarita calcarea GSE-NOS-MK-12-04C TaxID=2839659 RepID=A0A951URI7_9CYAN|nr:FAD-dependent oxidoreductase [Cyanomargarita calcarea GSE-NOS-MK-12-04C]